MELFFHTLENGIRLVHRRIPGIVAHCGLFINAGSRDEKPEQYGIAHFIEHMLFKGTRKRKAYYVISMLEDVGGELNAYTTKEDTIIYASFLTEHYGKAMELISDIAFNSVFPEKEIEKEKDVVLEEIHSYLDNPAELIFDEFEEMVFAGQPVAHNILGTVDTVRSFTRKQLFEFVSEQYRANDMVFCSVGDISDEKILRLFKSCFSQAMPGKKDPQNEIPWQYRPATVTKVLNTYQNHCIIGNIAYNIKDKRRMSLFLLNNILGGQGMNSRLNISMREKRGLAYNVESTYNPYIDTGLFTIYFGSDANNLEKSISVAMAEMKKLCTVRLGTIQLSRAKKQVRGYLARGYENYENLMLSLGKSYLVFNKIDPLPEIYEKIDRVTSSDLLETANEIFDPANLSLLIYK